MLEDPPQSDLSSDGSPTPVHLTSASSAVRKRGISPSPSSSPSRVPRSAKRARIDHEDASQNLLEVGSCYMLKLRPDNDLCLYQSLRRVRQKRNGGHCKGRGYRGRHRGTGYKYPLASVSCCPHRAVSSSSKNASRISPVAQPTVSPLLLGLPKSSPMYLLMGTSLLRPSTVLLMLCPLSMNLPRILTLLLPVMNQLVSRTPISTKHLCRRGCLPTSRKPLSLWHI
jgi:hypothetical protein